MFYDPVITEFLRTCVMAGLKIAVVGKEGAQEIEDKLRSFGDQAEIIRADHQAGIEADVFILLEGGLITAICDLENAIFTLSAGDGQNRDASRLMPTGLRPNFMDKLEAVGIHLPPTVFGIGSQRPKMDDKPSPLPPPPAENQPAPPSGGAADFDDFDDEEESAAQDQFGSVSRPEVPKMEEKPSDVITIPAPTPLGKSEARETGEMAEPEPMESTEREKKRELPTAEEKPAPEHVLFSLYHPKEAAATQWYTLLAYIHLESVRDSVQKNAQKFADEMGGDLRGISSRKSAQLTRGTEVRFMPSAEGIEFNPQAQTVIWKEDFERVNFRFRASADLIGEPCFGEMAIYVGPLEIATLRFSIFISEMAVAQPEQATVQAEMYHQIFASYSHQDAAIVKACEKAFKAIGYDVLIDYQSLRSGEAWSDALEKLIDQADIFQLFWSPQSSTSDHVRREWEYALTKQQGSFIRPVYWVEPMPPVPDKLAHLHFKFLPDLGS